MLLGSIAIANDLLGIVVDNTPTSVILRDKNGEDHEVIKKSCAEICTCHAYAALWYTKLDSKRRK